MILDGAGELVWFKTIPHGSGPRTCGCRHTKAGPCSPGGRARSIAAGRRDAGVVIADSSYDDIAIVRAGNGYQPDLHAFEITPKDTALFTVYDAIRCNLSAYGGPADGAVADTLLPGNRPAHRPRALGVARARPRGARRLLHAGGTRRHTGLAVGLLPHQRGLPNTAATCWWTRATPGPPTDVDARTGQIVWRLGGKHSSFRDGPRRAAPAWQHDARDEPGGTISFFDNGGTPEVHPQSRVIVLALERRRQDRDARVELRPLPPRCWPPARETSSRCPAATGSSAGARNRTSPNTRPPGSSCSTPTCPRPTSPTPRSSSPGGHAHAAAVACGSRGLPRRSHRLCQLERRQRRGAMAAAGQARARSARPVATAAAQRLRDRDRAPERVAALPRRPGARREWTGAGRLFVGQANATSG